MHHFAFFVSATQSVVVSTKKNQYSEANQKTGFCILFSCFLIYPLRISRFGGGYFFQIRTGSVTVQNHPG